MTTDKYSTLKGRIKNYRPVHLSLFITTLSILLMIFMTILTGSFFFLFVSIMFIVVFFANLYIFKKRGRFYIDKVETFAENISLHYYDNDNLVTKTIDWNNFDYYIGIVRGDFFLVVWDNNIEILKTYRTFGNNKQTFDFLTEEFKKHITPERIKPLKMLSFPNKFKATYTKKYDGIMKMY